MEHKWDKRFLELAKHVAEWSKDPSTRVGCVIANDEKKVVALGYNGFPKGIADTPERLNDRELKYRIMIHGEINALLNAQHSVRDATLYLWPMFACENCIKMLIQSGITRIVYPAASEELRSRWGESLEFAEKLAEEAGLELVELELQ